MCDARPSFRYLFIMIMSKQNRMLHLVKVCTYLKYILGNVNGRPQSGGNVFQNGAAVLKKKKKTARTPGSGFSVPVSFSLRVHLQIFRLVLEPRRTLLKTVGIDRLRDCV